MYAAEGTVCTGYVYRMRIERREKETFFLLTVCVYIYMFYDENSEKEVTIISMAESMCS